MALASGHVRVFHLNSEADVPKLEGWLRRGPKYLHLGTHEGAPRKVYLFAYEHSKEVTVGIVVSMCEKFNRDAIYAVAEKWRAEQ